MSEPQEIKTTICPMRPIANHDLETGQIIFYKCEEEECQWWDSYHKCCCVCSIAGELGHIADLLKGIGR